MPFSMRLCHVNLLPFFSSSTNEQYVGCTEYCPWFTPTSGDFFECNDKSTCDVGSEGLSCCKDRGGKAKCMSSYPVMCEDRALIGGVMDYTCRNNADNGCMTTSRKCYDYGELISGDAPFRPKISEKEEYGPVIRRKGSHTCFCVVSSSDLQSNLPKVRAVGGQAPLADVPFTPEIEHDGSHYPVCSIGFAGTQTMTSALTLTLTLTLTQTMTKAQVPCAVVWGIITVEKPSAPMQYMRKMPCRLEDVTQAKELKAAPPVEMRTAISLLREGHAPPEILWAYRSFATSRLGGTRSV